MLGIFEALFVGGAIYSITALGVFITFRILDFPDLTVEGSFPLGAVVMGICLSNGLPLWLGFILVIIGGVLAGICSSLIHNYLKVPGLLSGILTMMMLYSLNIRILGRPNLPLLNVPTLPIFASLQEWSKNWLSYLDRLLMQSGILIAFAIALIAVLLWLINLFFLTDLGIALGAMGGNQQMAISYGLNPRLLKTIGLGLSNGLVALSGALLAQYQGFADVGLGAGIIITGLAIVMMGEFCIHSNRISWVTFRILLGAIIYQTLIYFSRRYGAGIGFLSTDIKLMTGLLIILFLGLSQVQQYRHQIHALKQALSRFKINELKEASFVVQKEKAVVQNSGVEEPEEPEIKGEWL